VGAIQERSFCKRHRLSFGKNRRRGNGESPTTRDNFEGNKTNQAFLVIGFFRSPVDLTGDRRIQEGLSAGHMSLGQTFVMYSYRYSSFCFFWQNNSSVTTSRIISMSALFAAWKYKSLAVFSVTGTFIFGVWANYFFPYLNNDFFVALFLFGSSSLILSVVLSFESVRQSRNQE
jgi:hypothetical protein